MSSENFYAELGVLANFSAISDFSNYTALPDDWQIVVADIEDSTGAIAAGYYKAVNILGVSIITSIFNIAKPLHIPSVFGGDGAALCVPGKLADDVARALIAVKILAREQYELELRVGIIPVDVVIAAGYKVLVAKHRVSQDYLQAAFAGGGIEYAESLLKNETEGRPYRLNKSNETPIADFSGLECRWDNVPSKHGEIISLIVKALAISTVKESQIYKEVIAKIEDIYGNDELSHPVYADGLKLRLNNKQLGFETKLKTFTLNKMARLKFFFLLRIEILLGRMFMRFGMKTGNTKWSEYKEGVAKNTDFKKFDGTLRQVLSGTADQRLLLTEYLQDRFQKGKCVYGVHSSNSALVTCLIGDRSGEHYHFVDGADGGYAMAAAAMKRQLVQRSMQETTEL
ncbi:MAG: hypothetical protein ACI9SC_000721 [Gammaproteobacteria bacterium]|jgi:hypothetical protein